jgi:hypothetical protein
VDKHSTSADSGELTRRPTHTSKYSNLHLDSCLLHRLQKIFTKLCTTNSVKGKVVPAGHSGVGLGRLVAGIVGSNLAQGMDVCPRLSVLCCPV